MVKLKTLADGWQVAVPADDESDRLSELQRYQILDTEPSDQFDHITQLLARLLNVEFALVSLVDDSRQWFKSACGIDAKETPRDQAFCAHAIHSDDLLIIPNTVIDARFRANPLVTGAPFIRFYAGAPLINHSGFRLGTLCAISTKPRRGLSDDERFYLRKLSAIVIDELELHYLRICSELQTQAKGDFLSMIGHEIRAPIGSIAGMAALLEDYQPDEEFRRMVRAIGSSATHLTRMVNDLLDLAKMDAGKLSLEKMPIDLTEVITETLELVGNQARSKNIALHLCTDPQNASLAIGDPLRIRQVVLNLLNNAVKFTEHGSIHVCLKAAPRKDDESCRFEITIRDEGIGIAPERLPIIFNRFDQENPSTARTYGGSGLGLPISLTLCQLMGGTIQVQSKPGEGSVFRVTLSLQPCEAPSSSMSGKKQLSSSVYKVIQPSQCPLCD